VPPLFSIVTVCLNALENLRKTVSSVKAQNFEDYEYVVVDGSSTDGTVEFIRQLSLDHFVSEKDNGIFDAMNKGLQMCSGEYVCFMNAGDVFYDDYILAHVAEEIKKAPDIPFFYGDVTYPIFRRYYMIQPSRLTKFILFRTGVCHQAWFLRRAVYNETGGFDLIFKYKGDNEFLLRIVLEQMIPYKHLRLVVAEYMGGGFSVLNKKFAHKEIELIRERYFSPRQIYWFSIWVKLIDILRKVPFYESIMAIFSRLNLFLWTKRGR